MGQDTLTSDPTDVCADQYGLASCNDVLPYTQSAEQLNNVCMPANDRAAAMVAAANAALASEGVPPSTLDPTGTQSDDASFDSQSWKLQVTPGDYDDSRMIDPANAAEAANVVYHESRHTEQSYDMARMRAGLGDTSAQLSSTMHIPAGVAEQAAANPMVQCDEREIRAEQNYDSEYGAGAANFAQAESGTNAAAYCALPEEADAWRTGSEVTYLYPGGVDARNLQNCQ
jgi:hypothetical protein